MATFINGKSEKKNHRRLETNRYLVLIFWHRTETNEFYTNLPKWKKKQNKTKPVNLL